MKKTFKHLVSWVLLATALCFIATGVLAQEIRQINAPVFPTDPQSVNYLYSYRYFKSKNPTDTTIILLNGGPGATLMEFPDPHQNADGSPNSYAPAGVSNNNFNLIYTDQRGSGYNKNLGYQATLAPTKAYTVESMAYDVMAIVKAEQLQNYIVYGVSFGTVHATQVAALAEKLGLPRPKALVLEGIFGRSVSGPQYASNFSAEWERVKGLLDPRIVAQLSNPYYLPFGFSARAWGSYIQSQLLLGYVPNTGHVLQINLAPLASYYDYAGMTALYYKVLPYQLSTAPFPVAVPNTMPYVISCRDLFGSGLAAYFELSQGVLRSGSSINCSGIPFVGYDSAKFPVSMPIYYFQGPYDAATTPASAYYHFQNQKKNQRTFITVSQEAHLPFTLGVQTMSVTEAVWQQISAGNSSKVIEILKSSNWPMTFETRAPGQ
jgi:pimeloyl-ACP methyl ester carboxylesterase